MRRRHDPNGTGSPGDPELVSCGALVPQEGAAHTYVGRVLSDVLNMHICDTESNRNHTMRRLHLLTEQKQCQKLVSGSWVPMGKGGGGAWPPTSLRSYMFLFG
jgi:hypothetical protein